MRTTTEYIEVIKQYKERVAEKYGILRLAIFGSVARGEHHANSDLDIGVEIKEPDIFILLRIKYELEDILHCKIDIVRLRDNMNSLLKKNIERDGIYV